MTFVDETKYQTFVSESQEQSIQSELAVSDGLWLPFRHVPNLDEILAEEKERLGSQGAVSKEIGITTSALGRARKTGTLSTANCLRLAKATKRSADEVLRAAKKADVADLCHELYGESTIALREDERDLLTKWQSLSAPTRALILHVIASETGSTKEPLPATPATEGFPEAERSTGTDGPLRKDRNPRKTVPKNPTKRKHR